MGRKGLIRAFGVNLLIVLASMLLVAGVVSIVLGVGAIAMFFTNNGVVAGLSSAAALIVVVALGATLTEVS